MIKSFRIPDEDREVWREFTKIVAFERIQLWDVLRPAIVDYTEKAKIRIKKALR